MDKLITLLEYLTLMISVFCIFNARSMISKKVEYSKKNRKVKNIKMISTIVSIICMFAIIYI
ncbi:MAG: hypothetical protein IJ809_02830 [Clostridia bacterium]|nr:hypothetical protein [Clostridia bacterium]